jgi:stage V sporulation protein R
MNSSLIPDPVSPVRAERPLFEGADWEFGTIQRCHDEIAKIAHEEMGLDVYPNQIEIIGTEQMLDAYSSIGMPLFYKHWSFGKHFARNEAMYRAGMQGLAYEIVINSNPCISYIMEENTATMQTLVIAHAAFGHNHFFKNNYLFQQWTDANGILDYLEFARDYIASCEERYGEANVERLLDAAHALMNQAVHRYPRRRTTDLRTEEKRERERREHDEKVFNDLWRTVPGKENVRHDPTAEERRRALLQLPQENILFFLEKTAPRLAPWQREVLRIVRIIAQYFYPQSQTKVMNEGCATYCHYKIMNRLHEKGLLTDGAMVEFLTSHTNVVFQPHFDDRRYSGINPYALGFAMMQDIGSRISPVTATRWERCAMSGQITGTRASSCNSLARSWCGISGCSTSWTTPTSRTCGSRRSTTSAATERSSRRWRGITMSRGPHRIFRSSM